MIRQGDPASVLWENRGRMVFLENHDPRQAASYLEPPEALRAATVLLHCFDGTSLIHNGQEIGSRASTFRRGLFEHRCIDWRQPDPQLHALHRSMIWMRAAHPCLVRGALRPVDAGQPSIVAFYRDLGGDPAGGGGQHERRACACL